MNNQEQLLDEIRALPNHVSGQKARGIMKKLNNRSKLPRLGYIKQVAQLIDRTCYPFDRLKCVNIAHYTQGYHFFIC